jgi:hypothetical protein
MAAEHTATEGDQMSTVTQPDTAVPDRRNLVRPLAWTAVTVAVLVFLALTLTTGPDGVIRAEGVPATPDAFLGRTSWAVPIQIVCFTAWAVFLAYCVRANNRSRRNTGRVHPAMVVFLGLAVLAIQDPIQNWAVYAAYDPQLLHFPTTWPYFDTAPSVEPLLPFLLYPIAFGVPALAALWIYRRLVRPRLAPTGFFGRHPALTAFCVGEALAIPVTFVAEWFGTRTHTYTFTQLWPPITIFGGTQGQMHIFYEGPALGALIAFSTALLWQDDKGRTVLDRYVDRSPRLRTRPRRNVVLLAMAILSTYYLAYGVPYWMMRLTNSATSVVATWPLPDTKVYDPQHRLADAGVPGPYHVGPLAGWPSGQ